jgi:hypothetical protein
MPVGQRAITRSIENTQKKPAEPGQQKGGKVDPSQWLPYPAKKIKYNQH